MATMIKIYYIKDIFYFKTTENIYIIIHKLQERSHIMSNVHILYEGTSHDLNLNDLITEQDRLGFGIEEDVELISENLTADQIKRALANHFDKSVEEFNELTVDFHKNGNITVRPNASFGKP